MCEVARKVVSNGHLVVYSDGTVRKIIDGVEQEINRKVGRNLVGRGRLWYGFLG